MNEERRKGKGGIKALDEQKEGVRKDGRLGTYDKERWAIAAVEGNSLGRYSTVSLILGVRVEVWWFFC